MTKKKTYYQVHKNKKVKSNLYQKNNLHSVYKTIAAATELVNSIIRLRRSIFEFQKLQIPDYSKGLVNSGKIHIVGDGNYKEVITDKNGNDYTLENIENIHKMANSMNQFGVPSELIDNFINSYERSKKPH